MKTQSKYNASLVWTDAAGKVCCTGAAEIDAAGLVLQAAGIGCAPGQGTPAFDAHYRRTHYGASAGWTLTVYRDGAARYRNALRGIALPCNEATAMYLIELEEMYQNGYAEAAKNFALAVRRLAPGCDYATAMAVKSFVDGLRRLARIGSVALYGLPVPAPVRPRKVRK